MKDINILGTHLTNVPEKKDFYISISELIQLISDAYIEEYKRWSKSKHNERDCRIIIAPKIKSSLINEDGFKQITNLFKSLGFSEEDIKITQSTDRHELWVSLLIYS